MREDGLSVVSAAHRHFIVACVGASGTHEGYQDRRCMAHEAGHFGEI